MQRLHKEIPGVVLGTTSTIVYTAPSLTTSTVNNLSLTNTSNAPVTVTLNRVPASSGGVGVSVPILSAYSIPAGATYVPPSAIGLALAPGAAITAQAGAATAISLAGGVYETSGSP